MKNLFSSWNKHSCLVLMMIFFILIPIKVSAQSESEENSAALLFLGNQNLPPMVYVENGTPKGLVVDIVNALGEKMGQDIEIETMNWSDAQAIVAQGEADALIQINETQERKKIFDFSEPLLESEFSIFTLTGTTGISGIADISGLRVGVEDKGFPSAVLQTNPLINLVTAPSLQAAFEMLKAGSVDVVVADKRVGAYILANQKINGIIIVGEPIAKLNSSIAVKKGNTELLAEINKGISAIKEDGTYQKILDKWQPKEVVYLTQDQIRINQYETAFGVLILLLCVSIIWGILLFRQLSKRKNMEKLLAEERQRLSDIIIGTNVGTWLWNVQTGKMVFNERWAEIIGYTLDEIPFVDIKIWQEFICSEDLEETKKQLDQVFAGESDYYDAEYRMKHKKGNWVWVNTKGKVISRMADGKPLLCSGMSMDITDRKKAEDEILYLSYYDYLTGIYNRRFYGEELERLDDNSNLPLTLIMGDVNGLKRINDTLGHSLGDVLLKKAAESIKKGCRSGDIVARYGGDEFVIILPSTAKVEAEKIIKRINAFAKEEKVGGTDVSIAFGCATKENEDQSIQAVFKKAEFNMYRDKQDKRILKSEI